MLPDRVSNPGPLTYESGALPIALRGPAEFTGKGANIASLSGEVSSSREANRMSQKMKLSPFGIMAEKKS